ncbi:MAG: DUF805 domain-containing protein [Paramuribaculum sp.]|nr:DUF805 domain-containing protein [Paramuribaculum sp.]MDE6459965.1 DUF805 domain-containing protein [Paramuribaculum sp.]
MDFNNRPVPPLTFQNAVARVFSKYAQFSGRASRAEFWWFMLFCFIVNTALGLLYLITDCGIFSYIDWVFGLVIFIPVLAVCWRRLHDIGKGGGWWFINFVLIIGSVIFIIWCAQPSEPVTNRFGEVPAN